MEQPVNLTLEQLEDVANSVGQESSQQREHLLRMIQSYVRIIAARGIETFRPLPLFYGDADGYWDNSFPPKQTYKEHTGPETVVVQNVDFQSRATSSGFYHDLKYFTVSPGYYVDADGQFWRGTLEGTGRYGQFAAYPGEADVACAISYQEVADHEVPTPVLIAAERKLRQLAFPLAAASFAAAH
jgi:hypothetical protein